MHFHRLLGVASYLGRRLARVLAVAKELKFSNGRGLRTGANASSSDSASSMADSSSTSCHVLYTQKLVSISPKPLFQFKWLVTVTTPSFVGSDERETVSSR